MNNELSNNDQYFMQQALKLAEYAQEQGEVPVGAVVVAENKIIAEGWNQPISLQDPTAHAEVVALRAAAKILENYRLVDTTLYVTLEPCAMCAYAMVHARVKRLVYAASDPKRGAVVSQLQLLQQPWLNHHIEVSAGILAESASELLTAFFQARR